MNRRRAAFALAFALLSLLVSVSVFADTMAASKGVSPAQPRVFPEPPLRAKSTEAAVVVSTLEATPKHDIDALRVWNETQRPTRIGVVRELEKLVPVGAGPAIASDEPFRWRGTVRVNGAARLRLKLTGVDLPKEAVLWVYGSNGKAIGFDASLAHNGELWTPSVDGDSITLEVEGAPGKRAIFTVAAAADLRDPREVAPQGEECIKDAKCETGLDEFGTAVAHMQYVSGTSAYICSGGLIIESKRTFVPYFLTANHCVSTPAEAASLETFWDFKTNSCNAAAPSLSGLPRTNGSTVLATDAPMDVSLLRLTSVPSGTRYFLGWTSTAVTAGTNLYRISHPHGQPQRFSISQMETTSSICNDTPRTRYVYSRPTYGTVVGGSSGSPVVLEDAKIVGQLSGGCPGSADPCGTQLRVVDGSFSAAYTLLKPFLNPDTSGCTACVPSANTACMLDGRFKVTVNWRDVTANLTGNGSIINYADNRPEVNPQYGTMSQTTFFSMYTFAPNSIELMVRMLRGVNVNNKFWVFMTGFSPNEYTVTVTDTQTCATWTRTNQSGNFSIVADYNAFPF